MRGLASWGAAAILPAVLAAQSGAGGGARTGELATRNGAVELKISLQGGVLTEFRLAGDQVNPLAGMGHFLCLDRWGPPTEAEARAGMPFHGEASKVPWRVVRAPVQTGGALEAEMAADLPLAGLEIRRVLRIGADSSALEVKESVTNRGRLGRILNIVQHPTIGRPFLNPETRVDAGAGRGFAQSRPLSDPEPSVRWPYVRHGGRKVDLRRLGADPDPNVVSFEVRGERGWTTAISPRHRLLLGYVWQPAEYPWFNAWRHVERGEPSLRGLEFGTTGLHQPFPVLVGKGRIFDLPLYLYLDAGETTVRSYIAFLARVPAGFSAVRRVEVSPEGRITCRGEGARSVEIEAGAAQR